jgi:7-cyano-7-deazaguanine synthase
MRATVVPNRNAIMLDVAVARAVAVGAGAVAFGAHAGDHPIHPDCRPAFMQAYQQMALLANEGFTPPGFAVLAPFLAASKADIVTLGDRLGVPFADTWSCYRGGETHCGTCGTCVERREAFVMAGVADPTGYARSRGRVD